MVRIKPIFRVLLVLLCTVVLFGCGNTAEYSDEAFIKDMAKGLEARWDMPDIDEDATSDEERELRVKLVDAELNVIGGYTEKNFEDSKLQEYAIQYINLLKQQKESMDYFDADFEKSYDMWTEALNKRSQMMVKIDKEYDLPISSKYEDTWKDMTMTAKLADQKSAVESELKKMVDKGEFKKKENYGSYDCTLAITNTTDVEFSQLEMQINFLDKDGAVVESTSDFVSNWKPEMKMKFDFYVDKNFDKYTAEVGYYEIKED